MTTSRLRPEPIELLEVTRPSKDIAGRLTTAGCDDAAVPLPKGARSIASLVTMCALSSLAGIAGMREIRHASRAAPSVCSTVQNGPTSCVTVDGSSVTATMHNQLNVEVCGDFRLELLRDDGEGRRLTDPNQPSRSGCLPANGRWEERFALRRPGIATGSGALRPYRYMCVTGLRLTYGRWDVTGWACQDRGRAQEGK